MSDKDELTIVRAKRQERCAREGHHFDTVDGVQVCANCGLGVAPPTSGLTDVEKQVISLLSQAHNLMLDKVMGNSKTREADLLEWISHLHVLQHMVMSQAAGRAHPDMLRLLGGTVG